MKRIARDMCPPPFVLRWTDRRRSIRGADLTVQGNSARAASQSSYTIWPMRCDPLRFGSVAVSLIALTLVLGGQEGAQALPGQQHPSTTAAGLETIQIRPNVYVVFGAGANVTVHVGEDGLVLVDSGSGDMADGLLKALRV